MPLVHGFAQRIGNTSADPHHGGLYDAELHRNCVGGLEADAADIARQAIRVLGHDLDGIGTIGLENPYRSRRADTVAVQEDHDLPHRLLLGPSGKNAGSANRPDAIDLAQSVGRRLDDVEYLLAKGAHELLGINGANTPDHSMRFVRSCSLIAVLRAASSRPPQRRTFGHSCPAPGCSLALTVARLGQAVRSPATYHILGSTGLFHASLATMRGI